LAKVTEPAEERRARPDVCVVGCASWDTLLPVDRYPPEGEYCIAAAEMQMPGGTSTNTAITLARLGMPPRFVGLVGDDWRGERLRAGLEEAGVICDTLAVRAGQDSDRSIIPISPSGARTIFWIKGAMLGTGDALNLPLIFSHRCVYIDVVDMALWADILDAFERTASAGAWAGRDAPFLIGQAVFVAGVLPPAEAMALVTRHHAFVGGEWEWRLMAGERERGPLLDHIQAAMRGTRLHVAAVTHGAEGCTIVTPERIHTAAALPVEVVDTTGAGDAFAAGLTYGVLNGWPLEDTARFANAVGALATRALGSQSSLPTLDEAMWLAFGEGPLPAGAGEG
jgi:sugar/nucleoside kinase (ribokinase family)